MKRYGPYRSVVVAAMALLAVLAAPTASAQAVEDSFTTSVFVAEESELCASAQDVEECADIAAGASGDLTATVAGESDDVGSVQFDVTGCPDDRAGATIVVTGAAEGATVEGAFQGSATVGDETHEIDEHVGPVTIGTDGTARVSLCASASGGIDPGSGDLLGGLIETILGLLPL